jgi:hypothetical protein
MLYGIALACCVFASAQARTTTKVGTWLLLQEQDVMTDQPNIVATTFNNGGSGFAVRCLHGNKSVAVSEARTRYKEGDTFSVQLRVDRNEVAEVEMTAVADNLLAIDEFDPDFLVQLSSGKQLAVRVTGATSTSTFTFPISGTMRAISPVLQACKAAPSDKES